MKKLCRLADLPDPGSLKILLDANDQFGSSLCVVRSGGLVRVYENRCAHLGAPMDWEDGRFLDTSGTEIICALHGARFRADTGECVAGPCPPGARLKQLPTHVENGVLYLGNL